MCKTLLQSMVSFENGSYFMLPLVIETILVTATLTLNPGSKSNLNLGLHISFRYTKFDKNSSFCPKTIFSVN
jgi:hypothetical protein